jgi:hypothetical protein
VSIADEPRPVPDPLLAVVSELCAVQRIPFADGDLEAVTLVYREYLRLIETIDAAELGREAAPPMRLQILHRPLQTGPTGETIAPTPAQPGQP